MVPTSILWIGLALLALALLIIIGLLAHRVNRATCIFTGFIATDRDGDVFFYDLCPTRDEHEGVWQLASDSTTFFEVPDSMKAAMDPPSWDDEPRFVELWLSASPEMPPYPTQEDNEPF